MDKLQFLDLTDLSPGEEERLNHFLYIADYNEAVEFPPDNPPDWTQHPIPYQHAEPLSGDEQDTDTEQQVDYSAGSHMMPPQTIQMLPTPSVYVSNVTANVNVHGFMPTQPMAYPPPVPFIPPQIPVGAQIPARSKLRPAKAPNKQRSPEVRQDPQANYPTPTHFTPQFPGIHYPYAFYSLPPHHIHPRIMGVPYSPTPVYGVFPPPHHVQQPPSEPREENIVPYQEPEDNIEPVYQQQASEEEEAPVVDTVIVENSKLQQPLEVVIPEAEADVDEVKVEKPMLIKAPPANAFKSAPSLTQKPPFPPVSSKQKRTSIENGPEFIEPPVDSGPPKKSYASLFGSGDRTTSQMAQADTASTNKPLAMIHPTVHSNVNNVSPHAVNTAEKTNGPAPAVQQQQPPAAVPHSIKAQPEKVITDYDINMQRLGEFLTSYQLDHKPVLLQPRGLTNRSNYCYINAILQALIACPTFYNLMKAIPPSQENKNGKSRTPIIDSMVKFVNEFSPMSLNTRPVGRREKTQATKDANAGLSEVVTGPSFEPLYVYKMLNAMQSAFPVEGRQEDAEEFLSCLLNGLNDEMLEAIKLIEPPSNGLTNGDAKTNGELTTNGDIDAAEQDHEWTEVVNKSNKSVVTRRAEFVRTPLSSIFRGQMRSRVFRAGVENGTTDNVQPFFTLQLDIEKANSVEKALEQLMNRDEVLGGTCPKTNQEISMYTETFLEELPLTLLLHLKCFDYKLHTCSKITKTVEFPIDLKIDPKYLTCKNKNLKDRQYKLLAVVYHDGKEATKGHYMTDVYHMGYTGWVRYDDATVRPVTQQQVLNPKSPRVPYLLYYRRCDTIGPHDKNR